MDARRAVPRTDAVLADPLLAEAFGRWGRHRVRDAVRAAQQKVRTGELEPSETAREALSLLGSSSLRPVVNATGALLHTNLGRAPLSPQATQALVDAAGPTDVEYDLATGARAPRGRQALAQLRQAIPDAEDVLVVNNGAAALLLAVTALAQGREVLWSRGELVEIGDGFRLPDLVASTGARIREVGTTNRTTLSDYAVGPDTAAVLKVHPSNFVVTGFTSEATTAELAGLGVPVVVDVGSGLLAPHPLLPDEPSFAQALKDGAALVTGSGDKLLGGPQAGIVAGRADLVQRLRRHPMARALRVDKLTLAALEATLTAPTPTQLFLDADPKVLWHRASRLAETLGAEAVESSAVVGGGGAPGRTLDSWAVALPADQAEPLRRMGIVGRVHDGRLLLDLRAVPAGDDERIVQAWSALHPGGPTR